MFISIFEIFKLIQIFLHSSIIFIIGNFRNVFIINIKNFNNKKMLY